MRWDSNPVDASLIAKRHVVFGWLAAVGIGFWFIVGFPFGNHNESYYWLAQFTHHSIWDIAHSNTLAATPRPLGQGLAYAGWRLSGGSSWPIQIFNFGIAVLAFRAIALTMRETATFAMTMVVAGAAFFTGFIYLFHLHGVFYSPVLLVIALLLHFDQVEAINVLRRDLATFGLALAVALLFHPYALILWLAYELGSIVEQWKFSPGSQRQRMLLALLAALVLVASRPHGHEVFAYANIEGLLASYRFTEITPGLSVLSTTLMAATVLSIETMNLKLRIGLAVGGTLCAAALVFAGFPAFLLWVAAAVFKMAYIRRWSWASMMLSAALLPAIAPTGSPTYTIFSLVLSVIALAWKSSFVERTLLQLDARWVLGAMVLVALVSVMVRIGVELPLVSRLARPLLAEQEKTRQLEAVLDWMLASEYRNWNLTLEDRANPVNSGRAAIVRTYRPPTSQGYLDSYLASKREGSSALPSLTVTFGDHAKDGMVPVHIVKGRFAGTATVFK